MRSHRAALITFVTAAALVGGCSSAASSPAPSMTAAASPVESAPPSAASRSAGPGFDGRDAVVVVGRPGDALLTALIAGSGDQLPAAGRRANVAGWGTPARRRSCGRIDRR
jgi:hypothetical protein